MKTTILGKDKIKILFVRPPYHLWPIINESDNFLLPLGLPCLAAYLRQNLKNVEVKVIDCLPLKIGWRTLENIIGQEKADIIGVGDKVCYMHEGTKVLKIAKALNPDTITLGGGHFHSHLPEYSLKNFPELDFIVRYEGEETLKELINFLQEGKDLSNVASIAYRKGSQIITTPPRSLIDNLDSLPMPAYDIMPIERYSPFGKLWPRAITIQGARGCNYDCNFCSWSATEGEHRLENGESVLIPKLRLKSPARVLDEIDFLYNNYGVRYLFWVEGTWNHNHKWVDDVCEGIIRRGYKLGWWAFVRADLLLEQEKLGILEKMVRAGFSHTLFGGERPVNEELRMIGKIDLEANTLTKACCLLKRKYPRVFRQATFVTGIRTETEETMERLGKFSRDSQLDFAAFHPLMPWPGTPLWKEADSKGWIEEYDFSKFDMFYPVMPSEKLSRADISILSQKLYKDFIRKQPLRYLKGLFSSHSIRRRLHWWFLFAVGRVLLRDFFLAISGKKKFEGFGAVNRLWKPKWYNS